MSNTTTAASISGGTAAFSVLGAASLCHFLNDMMQALLPAVYPILQGNFALSFVQVGFLTFVYQLTRSQAVPSVTGSAASRSSGPRSSASCPSR
ncbi:MFS transporter [Paracoccus aminovorans]|uniref:MFS transporter n=1 Tax=Paracoccus aminovorans TaxID=34004 RepID=UPI001113BBA9|nr:MFS transporter [Paracoccus aminovorans]